MKYESKRVERTNIPFIRILIDHKADTTTVAEKKQSFNYDMRTVMCVSWDSSTEANLAYEIP